GTPGALARNAQGGRADGLVRWATGARSVATARPARRQPAPARPPARMPWPPLRLDSALPPVTALPRPGASTGPRSAASPSHRRSVLEHDKPRSPPGGRKGRAQTPVPRLAARRPGRVGSAADPIGRDSAPALLSA